MSAKIAFALIALCAATFVVADEMLEGHHFGKPAKLHFQRDATWTPDGSSSVSSASDESQSGESGQQDSGNKQNHWRGHHASGSRQISEGQQNDEHRRRHQGSAEESRREQHHQNQKRQQQRWGSEERQPEGNGFFNKLAEMGRKIKLLISAEEENDSGPYSIKQGEIFAHRNSHENTGKGRQVENARGERHRETEIF